MWVEKHFYEQGLSKSSGVDSSLHIRCFKEMLLFTRVINCRRDDYGLFRRIIGFLQFIQKMNESLLIWEKITHGLSDFEKIPVLKFLTGLKTAAKGTSAKLDSQVL